MILSRVQRKAQGQAAEDRFRSWLDRCCLPHIYVEQSPFTIPEPLRGEIKRPDFLVGIPTIGTIAVDVKAKRVYRNALIIDDYEHRTLLAFETFFNISVWFACFPPDAAHACHLFLNRNLAGLERSNLKGEAVIAVPLKMTRPADERRDFMAALMGAISLR
ncbi:MAG: hypothetical protein ABL907_10385 [Hyphomicrobium sp.]